ncbi:MAG: branched-chain amino acid ABC transporter permease, partial [Clostridium sp.]|nr:branched-chain amino acid ABC transporter permease [Clostridium sp.]
ALVAVVLGGFQTFYGPVLGAYIMGITRNLLLYYVSSVWGGQILYILILLFIVVRPYGLIGKKVVKKV